MTVPGKGKEFVPFPDSYDGFIAVPADKVRLGPDLGETTKIDLTNKGDLPILYKAKCTSNKRIALLDCAGVIEPGKTAEVNLKRRKAKTDSPDMICIVYTLMGELGGDNALYQWRRVNDQQIPTKNIIIEVTV
uniref:Major sperm protein n=1 Tax=Panagrellus redivivus TaxID=6233 RepID=A0A7E4VBV2_PANRE